MKKILLAIAFLLSTHSLFAKDIETGDFALNESLKTLNEQIKENPKDFIEVNLALRLNLSKEKLASLNKDEKLEYSEVFLFAYIAAKQTRSLDTILKDYKSKNGDWKELLFSYGIIKGNKEFKSLLKASDNIHIKPWKPSPRK